jgi:hypothetical protein
VQALQGGSAALNKRQAKALDDDFSQPQQVEFMLGCASCDYQQVGSGACLVLMQMSGHRLRHLAPGASLCLEAICGSA